MSGVSVSTSSTVTVSINRGESLDELVYTWTMEEARAIKDALVPIVGAGPPPPRPQGVQTPKGSNVVSILSRERACGCGDTCSPGHCYNVPC